MRGERHFGEGSVHRVGPVLDRRGCGSVFLVAGNRAFASSGAEVAIAPYLAGRRVVRFSGFSPNPDLADLERGVGLFAREPCDAVIAVGGGTAIDLAKLVALLSARGATLADVIDRGVSVERKEATLVAVPTTAGTGSEATPFATLYVEGRKRSIVHPLMLPDVSIVDPRLTYTLPPALTASTGLDAMCQAIESFWAVAATPESRRYARRAIELASEGLETAVNRPTPRSRRLMSEAAHLAGSAIAISRTTAAHAFSYGLTWHAGVPHGHAVAMTLGEVFLFNSRVSGEDVVDPRGAEWVRRSLRELGCLLGCRSAEEVPARWASLLDSIGLATRLSDVGVQTAEDRRALAQQVDAQRLSNNPRAFSEQDVREIFDRIR